MVTNVFPLGEGWPAPEADAGLDPPVEAPEAPRIDSRR